MRTTPPPPTRLAAMALAAAVLLGVTACGGDDGDAAPARSEAPATATAASEPAGSSGVDDHGATVSSGGVPVPTLGDIDGIGDLAAAVGGDELSDAISALGIFTKAGAVATALGGEAQEVDDTTARVVLDGDVGSDSLVACMVVDAVVDPTDTIILVYPNGETDCSD